MLLPNPLIWLEVADHHVQLDFVFPSATPCWTVLDDPMEVFMAGQVTINGTLVDTVRTRHIASARVAGHKCPRFLTRDHVSMLPLTIIHHPCCVMLAPRYS